MKNETKTRPKLVAPKGFLPEDRPTYSDDEARLGDYAEREKKISTFVLNEVLPNALPEIPAKASEDTVDKFDLHPVTPRHDP